MTVLQNVFKTKLATKISSKRLRLLKIAVLKEKSKGGGSRELYTITEGETENGA